MKWSQLCQQDPDCPRRGHIQSYQWCRNLLIPKNCGCTAMVWPRCKQQAFGCPNCNSFPTDLSHRRHKQGDSPAPRIFFNLSGLWYSLWIQQHDSCRALWCCLQHWNQITKQSRCPYFFGLKNNPFLFVMDLL